MQSSLVVCLYFDVLGFQQRSRRAESSGNAQHYLLPLSQRINAIVERINERAGWTDPPAWHWRLFSDNVLVWHVVHSDDGVFELAGVLAQAAWAQLELGAAGYFIRGALTMGRLHWDEHVVSGEPLFEAVELEKAARFPRLLVSPALLEQAARDVEAYTSPLDAPFVRDLWRSTDGVVFVNFLNSLVDEDELPESMKRRMHEDFRIHLARETASATGEARSKLLWLCSYHDHWVRANAPEPDREMLLMGAESQERFTSFMTPVRRRFDDPPSLADWDESAQANES